MNILKFYCQNYLQLKEIIKQILFQKINANIIEIPTSICFAKYQKENISKSDISNTFKIGWLGSKNTSVNVLPLKNVFVALQKKYSPAKHCAICP